MYQLEGRINNQILGLNGLIITTIVSLTDGRNDDEGNNGDDYNCYF